MHTLKTLKPGQKDTWELLNRYRRVWMLPRDVAEVRLKRHRSVAK